MRLVTLIALLIGAQAAGQASQSSFPVLSLQYSCLTKLFLSVSAYTPGHRSFPHVELRMIDPLGRTSGSGIKNGRIPKSQSGRIFEAPSLPDSSKAVAAEVCEASPGDYQIVVSEHSGGEYGLAVRVNNGEKQGDDNESMSSTFSSLPGRTCTYQFRFKIEGGLVAVRWLAHTGHVQAAEPEPVCEAQKVSHPIAAAARLVTSQSSPEISR